MTIATKVLVVIGFLQGLGQAASSSNCAMLLEAPCFSQLWNLSAESPASGALKLDDRLPVPSSKDIRRARLELRRTYSAEYKRDGREDLEAMAREFLRIAQTASEPSDLRYTLLEEALEKAIDAGTCDLALTVAKTIGKTYKVNARVLRYEALERLAKKHRGTEGALDDLAHLIRLTQDSRQARDYALADKSLTLARSRARNLGGEYLVDELNALRKRIAWEKARWSKVERSTDALARAEFGFLIEGQLGQAVALLRPGEDARAADTEGLDVRLPQAEAAAPESSATQLEVGALWMQRAEGGKWVDTLPFRRRAITWYLRALEPMPKGPDRLSLEQQILEYYRSHHDPVRGVPVDPWELSSRLPTESLAVARSLLWHDFSIRTDRRWAYSKHSVYLHNLSAESFLADRLRGQLSLLCADGRGASSVVRRELIYQARRHCLLGSWENEGEFVVWGTGGNIGNGEIERQNNGDWIPKNAHLLITLDGVPIFESFWMKPTSLWWLAE